MPLLPGIPSSTGPVSALICVLGHLGLPWPFVPVTVRLHLLLRGQEPLRALQSHFSGAAIQPPFTASQWALEGGLGLAVVRNLPGSLLLEAPPVAGYSQTADTTLYWVPNPSDTQGKSRGLWKWSEGGGEPSTHNVPAAAPQSAPASGPIKLNRSQVFHTDDAFNKTTFLRKYLRTWFKALQPISFGGFFKAI